MEASTTYLGLRGTHPRVPSCKLDAHGLIDGFSWLYGEPERVGADVMDTENVADAHPLVLALTDKTARGDFALDGEFSIHHIAICCSS